MPFPVADHLHTLRSGGIVVLPVRPGRMALLVAAGVAMTAMGVAACAATVSLLVRDGLTAGIAVTSVVSLACLLIGVVGLVLIPVMGRRRMVLTPSEMRVEVRQHGRWLVAVNPGWAEISGFWVSGAWRRNRTVAYALTDEAYARRTGRLPTRPPHQRPVLINTAMLYGHVPSVQALLAAAHAELGTPPARSDR